MDIEKELQDKIARMTDINKQLMELQKKIGALQEEGKAVYNTGLQLKGAIDFLLQKQVEEKDALAKSATAKLTLPVGCKPIVAEAPLTEADVRKAREVLEAATEEVPVKSEDTLNAIIDKAVDEIVDAVVETAEGTLPNLEVK
jgi:cell division septum initiation protein DivIVA